MDRELKLRIVIEKPPAGIDYGLQKGRGSEYDTVQTQRSSEGDLVFEFTVAVKQIGSRAPALAGRFVQGPAASKFVYIDIGTYAGQKNTQWSRRLKVPLTGISAPMIARLARDPAAVLETRIPGTGKNGEPNCATVKPFAGWAVKR
jgi:hypothetical protein